MFASAEVTWRDGAWGPAQAWTSPEKAGEDLKKQGKSGEVPKRHVLPSYVMHIVVSDDRDNPILAIFRNFDIS